MHWHSSAWGPLRDIPCIVLDAEVSAKFHGLVCGAELRNRHKKGQAFPGAQPRIPACPGWRSRRLPPRYSGIKAPGGPVAWHGLAHPASPACLLGQLEYLAAGVMQVVAMVRVQGLQEDAIGDGASCAAGLIQHCQDAPVGPLYQLHNSRVVEVLNLWGG